MIARIRMTLLAVLTVIASTGGLTRWATAPAADPLAVHLRRPGAGDTATVLPDGTLLIAGGIDATGKVIEAAELFDPATGIRTPVPPAAAPTARVFHTATLLVDGQVLLAGGVSQAGEPLATAELWDAWTHTLTVVTSKLAAPRSQHTATLLPNGTVLLWGGVDAAGNELTNGELFDPTSGELTPIEWLPILTDDSPPQLEQSIPVDGATRAPTDTAIGVRFSKSLPVAAVNDRTMTLTGPDGAIETSVVSAEGGMLAFVTPTHALREDSDYVLRIAGVADLAGLPLSPSEIRFHTNGRQVKVPGRTPISSEMDDHRADARLSDGLWHPDNTGSGDWRTGWPDSSWRSLPPLKAPAGVTALAGQVLRLNGQPLRNVRLELNGRRARTDASGRFVVAATSGGHHELLIDGGSSHGVFEVGVDLVYAQTTVLPYTIWLPKLDQDHAVTIPSPTTSEVVITTPLIPGLEVRIPPGTVLRDDAGQVIRRLSITPIPLDRPPFPLAANVQVPLYFTLQPGGTYVANVDGAGVRLIYPNRVRHPEGARFDFWNYDPEERGWFVYGRGTVSTDALQVVPDPAVSIYEFTGAMVAPPPFAAGNGPPPGGSCLHGWCSGGGGFGGGDGGFGDGGGCGGGSCSDYGGEPVNLATGLFVLNKTDLYLPDVIPIVFTRTYRQNDGLSRAFGMSTSQSYDMFFVGDIFPYTYIDLVLPDGGKIHYNRISPGTGYQDAVYENTTGPTAFYKSKIVWDATAIQWKLTRKDGTVYHFLEGSTADRPQKGAVIKIEDRFGNALTIARDTNGSTTKISSPNGRFINFTYETVPGTTPQLHRIKTATDNIGRQVVYTYDGSNRLAQVQDVGGGITTYAYDGSTDRLLTIRTPRQNEECPLPGCADPPFLTNQYYVGGSQDGLVQTQVLGDGSTYLFSYTFNANGKITQTDLTTPRFTVPDRRTTFDGAGYILSDTRGLNTPVARTVTYGRTAGELVNAVTEPVTDTASRTTTYTYDATGDLQTTTRLAGTSEALTTQFTYEPTFHQVATATDPRNHVTTFEYDPSSPTAILQSITDPTGRRTKLSFNAAGQLTAITAPFLVSDANPTLHTTSLTYVLGDRVGIVDPEGNTMTRFVDGGGRVRGVVDAAGRLTQYAYDGHNHLTQVTDALGGVTTFTYDRHGNLKTVEDARQQITNHMVTTYGYDLLDRMTGRQDPLGRIETFAYDAAGNLTRHTDRRGTITDLQYDSRDRRTCAGYGRVSGAGPDCTAPSNYERTIAYTHDQAGRLTQATDSVAGTITRTYDDADHLTSEATPPRGSLTYTYTKDRRQTMAVTGQPTLCYDYDDADRLTGIREGGCSAVAVVVMAYDAEGRRSVVTLSNGATKTYDYTSRSLLNSIRYAKSDATLLGDLTFGYDSVGGRTTVGGSWARTGLPAAVIGASYDDTNALLEWTTMAGTSTFSRDLNGNLQSDGPNTYAWNARNELTTITTSGAITAAFGYDALGRRIAKTADSTTTAWLYDGLNPVQELDGSAAVTANLLTGLGIDEFVRRATVGGDQRVFLTDALGSTVALTDPNGALQTQYRYEPFGQQGLVAGSPSDSNPYQFTGRDNDGTGLYYYRARYYSPTWGRFISEDPITAQRGVTPLIPLRPGRQASFRNSYAYALDNPMLFTDPKGLDCQVYCMCELFVCSCTRNDNGSVSGGVYAVIQGGLGILSPPWMCPQPRLWSCDAFDTAYPFDLPGNEHNPPRL